MLVSSQATFALFLTMMAQGDAANNYLRSPSRGNQRDRPISNVGSSSSLSRTSTTSISTSTVESFGRNRYPQRDGTTSHNYLVVEPNESTTTEQAPVETNPLSVNNQDVVVGSSEIKNEVVDPFESTYDRSNNVNDETVPNDIDPLAPNVDRDTDTDAAAAVDPYKVNVVDATVDATEQSTNEVVPLAPSSGISETNENIQPFHSNHVDGTYDSDIDPLKPVSSNTGSGAMEETSQVYDPFRINTGIAQFDGPNEGFDPFAVVSLSFADGVIEGYRPNSPVHWSTISIDQELLETDVVVADDEDDEEVLAAMQNIYSYGAHPIPVASVTLATPLASIIPINTQVTAESSTRLTVTGAVFEEYTPGANTLKIRYDTNDCLIDYDACLAPQGQITIDYGRSLRTGTTSFIIDDVVNQDIIVPSVLSISYTYDILSDNINEAKTFHNLANVASSQWLSSPSSDSQFDKFMKYYGDYDYSNKLFDAIVSGSNADFLAAEIDFTGFSWQERNTGITKMTIATSVWMGVVGHLEYAVENCDVQAWDEAVGLYIGNKGSMLYRLANEECHQFGTCNDETKMATVNAKILSMMVDGQSHLLNDRCYLVKDTMESIVQWMKVPLVQGMLRAAHLIQEESVMRGDVETTEISRQSHVEGMVFAASVLPFVHDCDARDASVIYETVQTARSNALFDIVRDSLQKNYDCMGLTCEMVGNTIMDGTGSVISRCDTSL